MWHITVKNEKKNCFGHPVFGVMWSEDDDEVGRVAFA